MMVSGSQKVDVLLGVVDVLLGVIASDHLLLVQNGPKSQSCLSHLRRFWSQFHCVIIVSEMMS